MGVESGMKQSACWVFVGLLVLVHGTKVSESLRRVEQIVEGSMADGDACLVCVVGLAILEENVGDNAQFWEQFLEGLCSLLPTIIERQACEAAVNLFGVDLIIELLEKYNPDYICGPDVLNLCLTCTVDFVDPKVNEGMQMVKARRLASLLVSLQSKMGREIPESVLPGLDNDGDYYSPVNDVKRAAKWRGRDCNDFAPDVHPGLRYDVNGLVDNNCNGIVGVDQQSGESYEK